MTQHAAATYLSQSAAARVVFDVSVAAFLAGEVAQSLRVRRRASPVDLRGEVVLRVVFVAGILALPAGRALAPGATFGGGAWLFALGAVVCWAGLLLRWWSFVTLGRYFTLVVRTSAEQPLVDRGPYRVLRHPGYAGLLLTVAGVGVMWGSWAGALAALALVTVALVDRMRREERAMTAAFGDRYREFAAHRARIVPHVY